MSIDVKNPQDVIVLQLVVIKVFCVFTFLGWKFLTAFLELLSRIFSRNLLINFILFWLVIALISPSY